MPEKALILIAARDPAVRGLVSRAMRRRAFRVEEAAAGIPTSEELADLRPDVVVLEAEEPPRRAHDHLRWLAANGDVPVLAMSPFATPTRVADGLDAGAADFIARPFDEEEFAARVRALVRRRSNAIHSGRRWGGAAEGDLDDRGIRRDGRSIPMTRPEWSLLAELLHHEGRIVMREELLTVAFGDAARDDASSLRLAVSRLRRKLGFPPWDEGPIRTVHGMGYTFDSDGSLAHAWSGRRGRAAPETGVDGHQPVAVGSAAAQGEG